MADIVAVMVGIGGELGDPHLPTCLAHVDQVSGRADKVDLGKW